MSSAHPLIDHDDIRTWAEARHAQPACVRRTGGNGDPGMIRLDFPGFSGARSLAPISWDQWFRSFDDNNLALLVQDRTARGQPSNFNKLVSRESGTEGLPARRRRKQAARAGAGGRRKTSPKAASAGSGARKAATKRSSSKGSSAKRSASARSSAKGASARRSSSSRSGQGSRAAKSQTSSRQSTHGRTRHASAADRRTTRGCKC